MKTLRLALILPILAAAPAFSQDDDDFLTPRERMLGRHPDVNFEWTWMTEGQATQILIGHGFDIVLSLEKNGSAWRGKAMRDKESYNVAVNRYGDVFGHLDKKSLSRRALLAEKAKTAKAPKNTLATLNGPVAAPTLPMAPTRLTPGRLTTVMGEIGWTWMSEEQVRALLERKGYSSITSLRRGAQGLWRAKAIKDDLASRVAIDVYGNVETQPQNLGGLAQASESD